MKTIRLVSLFVFVVSTLSFHSMAQNQSVLVVGQKGYRDFVITVVNPKNEETYIRYKYRDHSYNVMLKKELDKWLIQGFKIVDSSTSFAVNDGPSTHEVVYILVKESLIKIKEPDN